MVEKFKGFLPPGSIWYKLTRDETIALMQHEGTWENMTSEQREALDSSEIQLFKGKSAELEQKLKDAGLNIVTLF